MAKILIADDDARIRQMLRQTVTNLASSIYEAIAVCAKERPDWVLMDLRMKPVDGLRATADIKARFPETASLLSPNTTTPELRAKRGGPARVPISSRRICTN